MSGNLPIDPDAYEAFGLQLPEDTAADGGETDNTEQITDNGRSETNPSTVTNLEDDEDSTPGADGDEAATAGDGEDGGRPGAVVPTADEKARNAKNAERRRRNEERVKARIEAEADRARIEERARLEGEIKALGIVDPATGETVDSFEKLERYKSARAFERARDGLATGDLTPEAFNAIVEQTPAFRQIQAAAQKAEALEREAKQTQAEAEAARQISEITRYDPSIKSIEDLLKLDRFEAFQSYVLKGLTFIEAYRLSYADKIEADRASSAATEAARLAKSKQHLTRTETRGSAPREPDADIIAGYNEIFPEWKGDINKIREAYLR
jgi:hypothetical protein